MRFGILGLEAVTLARLERFLRHPRTRPLTAPPGSRLQGAQGCGQGLQPSRRYSCRAPLFGQVVALSLIRLRQFEDNQGPLILEHLL